MQRQIKLDSVNHNPYTFNILHSLEVFKNIL